jgi:predicted Fe-Mo cluster-binding NifX family protein
MKIAVPVHDEVLDVFVRVGRAPWFAIFEDGHFLELRPNHHTHEHDHEGGHHDGGHGYGTHDGHGRGQGRGMGHGGGHGQGHGFGAEEFGRGEEAMDTYSAEEVELHRKDLANLADVDVMLARAVGPNMKEALELIGIEIVRIRKKDGERADEVALAYWEKGKD